MRRKRVVLVGFTVPSETLAYIHAHDSLMQTQTHRFAWSLVRSLRENSAEVTLLSSAPVSDFPRNRRVLWRRRRFEVQGVQGVMLPFVNVTVLKHVTRYLACWLVGMKELRSVRPDWIVVHGVHSPFLWFAVAAGRRVGARVAVMLTDPPGVIRADDGGLRLLLKRIDRGIVTKALARTDAVVVLTEPLARDFAPGVPSLVVEGLFDAASLALRISEVAAPERVVVFAGSLHVEYGVKELVQAVRSLTDVDIRLELYGRGPLEGWLQEQSMADPRIMPPRLLPPDALPEIYAKAAVLVQPRQVDQDFVPYSFPSKLIEYLASATPVLSTRLPSIPTDYEPYVVWCEGDGSADLALGLRRVLGWTPAERLVFGTAAATFMRESRNTGAQGRRIMTFLAGIAANEPRDE